MNGILIISGGVYTVALIIFHVLFWKIFKWPETLEPCNYINKATIQVLNISISFIFFIFAYVSFVHTQELLETPLGHSLLALISCLWLFRAILQVMYYQLKHKVSIALTVYFSIGALLYGIPVIA